MVASPNYEHANNIKAMELAERRFDKRLPGMMQLNYNQLVLVKLDPEADIDGGRYRHNQSLPG